MDVRDIRNEKMITDRAQRVKGSSYIVIDIVNDVFHDKKNSSYTVLHCHYSKLITLKTSFSCNVISTVKYRSLF